jgi:hypothetical protein
MRLGLGGGGVEELPPQIDLVDALGGEPGVHLALDADGVLGEEERMDIELERH